MKIVADESVEVLSRSREANAVLVTADKDFGELVFRQGLVHSGVVLIRLAGLTPHAKSERVAATFRTHADELIGAFAVVSERSLPAQKEAIRASAGSQALPATSPKPQLRFAEVAGAVDVFRTPFTPIGKKPPEVTPAMNL